MSVQKNRAIVLVSGGMDSLVTAAIAHRENQEMAFLHLNYGHKTEEKELACFKEIAAFYEVPPLLQKTIDMGFLKEIGGSSLTDSSMEVTKYQGETNQIPTSYVPFRNTLILSLAVSWAEVIHAQTIYIGAVFEDSSGYPDCRPSYYEKMNALVKEGTKEANITIKTPLIYLSKSEIVKKALEFEAPLHSTWSCYAREDKACGECDSCILRLKGFKEAGMEDPLPYAIDVTGLPH